VTRPGTGRWLRPLSGGEAGVRLVCFPHVGGSASFFLALARAMPDCVELVAVQYPGRQDRLRERPLSAITELARHTYEALLAQVDLPTALFGHSMGALVAFEVARRGGPGDGVWPVALFVSGSRAPGMQRRFGDLHSREDTEILAELARLGGTDGRLLADEAFRRMIVPAVRADLAAIETYDYRWGPALRCPVTALVGARDPLATVADVHAWSACTTGPFATCVFPGGHFYLAERNEDVAARLAQELGSVIRGQASLD